MKRNNILAVFLVLFTKALCLSCSEQEDTLDYLKNKEDSTTIKAVWQGNPFMPMTFLIEKLESEKLTTGDKILIFDNNICVGEYEIPETGFQALSSIITSLNDESSGSLNGFITHNKPSFFIYQKGIEKLTKLRYPNIIVQDTPGNQKTDYSFKSFDVLLVSIKF